MVVVVNGTFFCTAGRTHHHIRTRVSSGDDASDGGGGEGRGPMSYTGYLPIAYITFYVFYVSWPPPYGVYLFIFIYCTLYIVMSAHARVSQYRTYRRRTRCVPRWRLRLSTAQIRFGIFAAEWELFRNRTIILEPLPGRLIILYIYTP